jgi:hypothetical protein
MTHREALAVLAAHRGQHIVVTTHGSVDVPVGHATRLLLRAGVNGKVLAWAWAWRWRKGGMESWPCAATATCS